MDFGDLFGGGGLVPEGRLAKVLAIIGFVVGAAIGGILCYHLGFGRIGFADGGAIAAFGGALVGGFIGAVGAVLFGVYLIGFLVAAIAFFAVIGWDWLTGTL